MKFIPAAWYYWAYVVFTVGLVVGIFFSMPAISVAVIAYAVLFLIEPGLKERFQALIKNKVSLWMLAFFGIHVIGLLWTTDFSYALKDLRIKLPLLAMPIVLGTACKLEKREVKIVWWFFLAAAFVAACISVAYGLYYDLADKREWSPFISHIRLSLLIILAFFVSLFYAKHQRIHTLAWLTFVGLSLVFLIFLFSLNALSGIVALVPALIFWIIKTLQTTTASKSTRISAIILAGFIPALMVYSFIIAINFFTIKDVHFSQADKHTINGEAYRFEWGNPTKENGHYVKYYLADNELQTEWNRRSNKPLYNSDGSVKPLLETVHRYITSKGLRKDSVGVNQLSDEDIQAIESGCTNHLFLKKNALWKRIYATIWEVDRYYNGLGASGGSLTQRFVYWQTAFEIIKDYPFIGVGTGDVQQAFNLKYDELNNLDEQYRLRAHNQYLTIWLTFGPIGLLIFCISLLAPFIYQKKNRSVIFTVFWIIAVTGMLNEDTLETQVGVTFFSFFFFWIFNRGMGYSKSNTSL